MKYIMLDLETMGTHSRAPVASVGACSFSLGTGEIYDEFHYFVQLQSVTEAGFRADGSTIEWWLNQPKEAQEALLKGEPRVPIHQAVAAFKQWLWDQNLSETRGIWGKSPSFDVAIIKNCFKACKQDWPFKYWAEYDVRTLTNVWSHLLEGLTYEGVAHDALDDCKRQIKQVSTIWQTLNKTSTNNGAKISAGANPSERRVVKKVAPPTN